MTAITGLHHVSVIAGDPQQTLDFYVAGLGMRLVKRTVNQDAPDTYHFFFADGAGTPGTELTFFPWPNMPRGRAGHGLTNEVSLAVPPGSLDFWAERLAELGVAPDAREVRFGEPALPFADPSGLRVTLVETGDERAFTPWDASPVPAEYQVRGLHAVRIDVRDLAPTARFLDAALGHSRVATEGDTRRYAVGGRAHSGALVDLRETPSAARGMWGVGSVHHVAFRTPDDATELEARRHVQAAGGHPTDVIDRFWFHSVYFREPGGALFEIATDGPGFAMDEDPAALGERLILPPFLEAQRPGIERVLPPVVVPHPAPAGARG